MRSILTPSDWTDYELIDSGEGAKLERFGTYIISRPDPRAIWNPCAPKSTWEGANATYVRSTKDDGHWNIKTPPPDDWKIRYHDLVFTLKPTSFKHVGVFPEQAVNWEWMERVIGGKPIKVLNLFAYTGGATLACLSAGAEVVHVDSSKPAIDWANDNLRASGLQDKPVHWILEDVVKFVNRETRRGHTYDGLILDPPRFGRGTKGEVWKIEEDLPNLLTLCRSLLSPKPAFVLINAYTADLASIVLGNMLTDMMDSESSFGELALKDTTSGRLLPNGIFARWSAS